MGQTLQMVFRRGVGVTVDGKTFATPNSQYGVLSGDLNGPWTILVPGWARAAILDGCGAGGGGGGGHGTNNFSGGGGGAGMQVFDLPLVVVPGETMVVTVPAGGVGGGVGLNGEPYFDTAVVPANPGNASVSCALHGTVTLAGGVGGQAGQTAAHGISGPGGIPNAQGSRTTSGSRIIAASSAGFTTTTGGFALGSGHAPTEMPLSRGSYFTCAGMQMTGWGAVAPPGRNLGLFGEPRNISENVTTRIQSPGGYSFFDSNLGPGYKFDSANDPTPTVGFGRGGFGGQVGVAGGNGGNGLIILTFMERAT